MSQQIDHIQAQIIANSLCLEFEYACEYIGWTPEFPCCFVSPDNAVRFNTVEELHEWYGMGNTRGEGGYLCFEIYNDIPF